MVIGVLAHAGRAHKVRDGADPLGGLAQVVQGFFEDDLFVVWQAQRDATLAE